MMSLVNLDLTQLQPQKADLQHMHMYYKIFEHATRGPGRAEVLSYAAQFSLRAGACTYNWLAKYGMCSILTILHIV